MSINMPSLKIMFTILHGGMLCAYELKNSGVACHNTLPWNSAMRSMPSNTLMFSACLILSGRELLMQVVTLLSTSGYCQQQKVWYVKCHTAVIQLFSTASHQYTLV